MSALTQFFGGGAGGSSTAIDAEILLVNGGDGLTKSCYYSSPTNCYYRTIEEGQGGAVHYTNIKLTPGITVPVTVGAGGSSFCGTRICCYFPSPVYWVDCYFGTCGCASCFGDCVYFCIVNAYCPCLVSVTPTTPFSYAPETPFCRKELVDSLTYNRIFAEPAPFDASNNYLGSRIRLANSNSDDRWKTALRHIGATARGYDESIYDACTNTASFYYNAWGTNTSYASDPYREIQNIASPCVCCSPPYNDYATWYGAGLRIGVCGFLSEISGSLELYGAKFGGASSTGCTPCIYDVPFFCTLVFNPTHPLMSKTGHGFGGKMCHNTCMACALTCCGALADPGTVFVRYPDSYNAATISSPNYCDCSPQTPGYRTYRFLAPGTITLP